VIPIHILACPAIDSDVCVGSREFTRLQRS